MSKRPDVATVSMGAIARILTVINNTRIQSGPDGGVVATMRDALIASGVIKWADYYDCTFSDFYAERDDNAQ